MRPFQVILALWTVTGLCAAGATATPSTPRAMADAATVTVIADEPSIATVGGGVACGTDRWIPTSQLGAPAGFRDAAAVWTGERMVVWGGVGAEAGLPENGGIYDPVGDTWQPMSLDGAPTPNGKATAVWTGREVLFWGGEAHARYDPATNSWADITEGGAPAPRSGHVAVWTGNRMIVWGGAASVGDCGVSYYTDGAAYDPVLDRWDALPDENAPFFGRDGARGVWTGSEMIVWGGGGCAMYGEDCLCGANDAGGRFDPETWTWSASSRVDTPADRHRHTAVWTGAAMLVYGGTPYTYESENDGPLSSPARYDPVLDRWHPVNEAGSPGARFGHTAVWTGHEVMIWGGSLGASPALGGGRYLPYPIDAWLPLDTTGAPPTGTGHVAVYANDRMIVWGGAGTQGGVYVPAGDPDDDAFCLADDNCPYLANPDQGDADGDGIGDACDLCPAVPDPMQRDSDEDGVGDACDVCPAVADLVQADTDADGVGNACDVCSAVADPAQDDTDGDGLGDACDACALDPENDDDGDGVCGGADNCPGLPNAGQVDTDGDGVGNACDDCPAVFDPVQGDLDADTVGNACDNCPAAANASQADADGDGLGDACDPCPQLVGKDLDGDGICDVEDNCPTHPNPNQTDGDDDGVGDECDNCPETPNPDQADADGDALGTACDNCPDISNPAQTDTDQDDLGDVCDPCVDADHDGACDVPSACADTVQPVDGELLLWQRPGCYGADCSQYPFGGAAVSADGRDIVYAAEPGSFEAVALFSLSAADGSTWRHSPVGIRSLQIGPRSERIIYLAPTGSNSQLHLFSAPLGGTGWAMLDDIAPADRHVQDFKVSADGSTVAFKTSRPGPRVELHAAATSGQSLVAISGPLVEHGIIWAYEISADGAWVVYVADQEIDNVLELYSASTSGGGPVRLSPDRVAGGFVASDFRISPDGTEVMYRAAEEADGQARLYRVPIDGGPARALTPDVAGPVGDWRFTPDGLHALYRVGQTQWRVPLEGGAAQHLVDSAAEGTMVPPAALTPDGNTLVYLVEAPGTTWKLFQAPAAGGAATLLVEAPQRPTWRLTSESAHVVYSTGSELSSVALDGGPPTLLESDLDGGFTLSPDGTRVAFEKTGETGVFVAPVAGGAAYHATDIVPEEYSFFPDGRSLLLVHWGSYFNGAFYVMQPRSAHMIAVAADEDPDGDGAGPFCDRCPADSLATTDPGDDDGACGDADNCAATWNPDQSDSDGDGFGNACDCSPFDATSIAPGEVEGVRLDKDEGGTLRWTATPAAGSYSVTRGTLETLSSGLDGACLAAAIQGTTWSVPATPDPGQGLYYLVQAESPLCGVGPLGWSTQGPRVNVNPGACP